jgi:hypothetical protein
MQCLINASLGIEAEAGIHLRGDLSRHNLQDLRAELDEQVVERRVDLIVNVLAVRLAICNSLVNQLCVFGLLGGGEDERGVGRGILRLVLVDGCEVAGVANDDLMN